MKSHNKTGEDYGYSFTVICDAGKAFDALSKKIGDWWGEQNRPAEKLGDTFTVSWGEPWYRFKIIEYELRHKICWECIDANQIIDGLEGVQKEWVGTQLIWTIKELDRGRIKIIFTHRGLVPEFICYEFCSSTWDNFLGTRLKKYLETSS